MSVPLGRRTIRYHRLAQTAGIRVASVEPKTPAERSGLRAGDIVVAFAGSPLDNVDALHRMLTEDRVGAATPITVLRGAEKLELSITPAEAPSV
jgi:S1-C subfamily serine protease